MNISKIIDRMCASIYGRPILVQEQKSVAPAKKDAAVQTILNSNQIQTEMGLNFNWEMEVLDNSKVFSCINLISKNIARMKIKVDDFADGATGLYRVFESPNSDNDWYHFVEQITFDLLVYGVAYILGNFDESNTILTSMYSVNPKAIQVERNEAGVKTAYSFRNRRGAIREAIEGNGRCKILEIKYGSYRHINGLDGFVSPCRLIRTSVKLYNDINQHNALMVKHYPRLGGVLLAESMTNSQHEVSREVLDWKSKIPGYIPILRGKDMDFEYDNHVKNCDYLDGKRDASRQIMEIFGIPETLMNPSGTAHNYAQILKHFREDTLCPLAEKIAHRLEGWLNNFMPVKFALNLDKIGYSPDQMLDKISAINDCDFIDNETKREICEIDE